jgi:hypothetical protein
MNRRSPDWGAWPVEAPPPGFADRVVALAAAGDRVEPLSTCADMPSRGRRALAAAAVEGRALGIHATQVSG